MTLKIDGRDDHSVASRGPWPTTRAIWGGPGSYVYDRLGRKWTRYPEGIDAPASDSWYCHEAKLWGDPTGLYGPFINERNKDMATSLTVQRSAQKDAIAQAEAALEKARAALASFTPDEPTGLAAVVRFKKFRHAYSYAAIRVGDRWYVTQDGTRTSRQGVAPLEWDDLLEWIGDRNWDSIEVLS